MARATDGKGFVKDYTLTELRALNASHGFGNTFAKTQIPTLEEYFKLVQGSGIVTNIEMKTGVFEYRAMERAVPQLIEKYGLDNSVILTSFNHYTIVRMKQYAPQLTYGFLTADWIVNAGEYLHRYGVTCYHPGYLSLVPEVVQEVKRWGHTINCYTVLDAETVLKMQKMGIDGVIVNDPVMALRALGRQR